MVILPLFSLFILHSSTGKYTALLTLLNLVYFVPLDKFISADILTEFIELYRHVCCSHNIWSPFQRWIIDGLFIVHTIISNPNVITERVQFSYTSSVSSGLGYRGCEVHHIKVQIDNQMQGSNATSCCTLRVS